MNNYKLENDTITVSVRYDGEKVLTSEVVNGKIVDLKKPIIGAWCIQARPNQEGTYLEGIGIYSVCYELTEKDAHNRALDYLKKV